MSRIQNRILFVIAASCLVPGSPRAGASDDPVRAVAQDVTVNLCDGLPLTARWITETILAKEESK